MRTLDDRKPVAARPAPSGDRPRPSLVVLVADADPAAQAFYRTALPSLGHQLHLAESGRQFLDLARAVPPDLLIADARLPDADGFGLIATACHDRPVPAILVTATPDADAAWRTARGLVQGYLAKPLGADALGAAIAVAAGCFDRLCAVEIEAAQLRQALEDRKVIERAKGMVMRFAGVAEDDAYRRMRRNATDRCQKLVEVAREILAAGEAMEQLIGPAGAHGRAERPRGPSLNHVPPPV